MARRSISIRLQLDDADAAQAALAGFLEAFTPAQRGRLLLPAIEGQVRGLVAGLTGGGNAAALAGDTQAVAPVQLAAAKRRSAAQKPAAVQDSSHQGDVRTQATTDKTADVTPPVATPLEPQPQAQAQPAAEPEPAQPAPAVPQAATPAAPSSVPPSKQPNPNNSGRRTGLRALMRQAETI